MKEKIKQLVRYHQIKAWYEKYERVLIPGTLVLGVIIDSVTFTSINITTAFILLGVYFLIAAVTILFLNLYDAEGISSRFAFVKYLRLWSPLIIQFTFGALLSGSFIFYFFSGTLFVSWPFIALMVILMVSNDVFRHYYLRPAVQISVLFFILFSLVAILLPFALNSIEVKVFLFAGGCSLLIIFLYLSLLRRMIPRIRSDYRFISIAIVLVFITVNGLYFLNVIPPIPLSMRDTALAHNIEKTGGNYQLLVEDESRWHRTLYGRQFHKVVGQRMYVYTAIFAPGTLKTNIVHHWQYYDETTGEWVTKDRLSFAITGGKKTGYRGFSAKTQVGPGEWRVDVETERGQVLGRTKFRVLESDSSFVLKTVTK